MTEGMRISGNKGFTFLETIMALAVTAMMALFAAGFIRPHVKLYDDFGRLSQAKSICGQAYVKLEKALRYGYMYYVDLDCPEMLSFYVRRAGAGQSMEMDEDAICDALPPADKWPAVSAKDLKVGGMEDMSLKLDFSGTTSREVRALIMVMREDKEVYEQAIVIRSMYDGSMGGTGYDGR